MPDNEDNITLAELYRAIERIEIRQAAHESKFVARGEYEETRKAEADRLNVIEKTITKIESTLSTINRTAWTGVILPIFVLVWGAILLAILGVR
jgi:hypothetical protein